MTEIRKVGVVGCGLMGSGIAQIAATAGHQVVVVESNAGALETGLGRIRGSLAKLTDKGKISTEMRDRALVAIESSDTLEALGDCDLVVEAIVEDLEVKKTLFADLGRATRDDCILASNTSSFPISAMAEASGRPSRVLGLHFFNPVPLMKLVEVVQSEKTDDDAFAEARAFAERCGKAPIRASDTPGFVVNRLLVPYLVEAIRMLERGEATKEDIDTGMMLGCGHPMGPLTLLDYVGLDTTLFIIDGWHERFPNDPLFTPPESLRQMVAEGRLGRKSGRGFYEWDGDKRK